MGEEICRKENVGACDDDSPSWVIKIESEVKEHKSFNEKETATWKKHSIFMLPKEFVRDKKRVQAYKPRKVSLGPYHHRDKQLQPMEEHKERALRHLHMRTKKSVKEYRRALKEGGVLQQLMDSYKDLDPSWREDKEEFLKLMILDGCFMLEVMRVVTHSDFYEYDANDPIFSYHGMLSNLRRIKRDMLLLENQIPLLVLHKLLAVEKGLIHEQDKGKQLELHQELNNTVLDFFQPEPSLKYRFLRRMHLTFLAVAPASTDDHEVWGLHVLDVVRRSMIEDIKGGRRRSVGDGTGNNKIIRPATQLEEAGIRFKKSDRPNLNDISFRTGFFHATLSLPQLLVDNSTKSKFLNLMAFEHLHTGSRKDVSSYIFFMHNIIDSDKDVSLLSKNNIINNLLGTDQKVADLFNDISHDVSIDQDSNLGIVHYRVTAHCNHPLNKYRASKNLVDLKRSYLRSPWTFISLVTAFLILSLTIIQSVYAILQYHKPN